MFAELWFKPSTKPPSSVSCWKNYTRLNRIKVAHAAIKSLFVNKLNSEALHQYTAKGTISNKCCHHWQNTQTKNRLQRKSFFFFLQQRFSMWFQQNILHLEQLGICWCQRFVLQIKERGYRQASERASTALMWSRERERRSERARIDSQQTLWVLESFTGSCLECRHVLWGGRRRSNARPAVWLLCTSWFL